MNSLAETFNPKLIAKSWVDSLKIFIPANFKLFALVTLKSFIEGLKAFFSGVFWVGAFVWACAALLYYFQPYFIETSMGYGSLESAFFWSSAVISILFGLGNIILRFGWLISIRSSVDKKDAAYVKKYLWDFPAMAIMGIIVLFLFSFLGWFLSTYIQSPYVTLFTSALSALVIWIVLFFFVESGRTIEEFFQSFWRMKLFFIFNLPGLLIFGAIVALFMLFQVYISDSHWIISIAVDVVGFMLFVCALYNYFIKRFHDHSELYF